MQAPGDPAAEYGTSEDCLYPNIWKASGTAAGKKPVMVWIYGGAAKKGCPRRTGGRCRHTDK